MATYSKLNLTIDNFESPVTYKSGKGTAATDYSIYNFYDTKLDFLRRTYDCSIYTLETPNFLPNISVKYYGTSSLWWVIARFNGIIFPLSEIKVGTILYIPDLSSITKYLNQAQTKTSSNSDIQRVIL